MIFSFTGRHLNAPRKRQVARSASLNECMLTCSNPLRILLSEDPSLILHPISFSAPAIDFRLLAPAINHSHRQTSSFVSRRPTTPPPHRRRPPFIWSVPRPAEIDAHRRTASPFARSAVRQTTTANGRSSSTLTISQYAFRPTLGDQPTNSSDLPAGLQNPPSILCV